MVIYTHIPTTLFIWKMHILFKPSSIWTIFVALNAPSKVLWNLWKQWVTSKHLMLQNVNWSYVATHILPTTPFIWRMHIMFKLLSIWMIFVALDAPSKVLQNIFWSEKKIEWHPKILSSKMQIGHTCEPTSCPWLPSLGEGISCSNLHWFEQFLLH